jgi:hypothetical protein
MKMKQKNTKMINNGEIREQKYTAQNDVRMKLCSVFQFHSFYASAAKQNTLHTKQVGCWAGKDLKHNLKLLAAQEQLSTLRCRQCGLRWLSLTKQLRR